MDDQTRVQNSLKRRQAKKRNDNLQKVIPERKLTSGFLVGQGVHYLGHSSVLDGVRKRLSSDAAQANKKRRKDNNKSSDLEEVDLSVSKENNEGDNNGLIGELRVALLETF